MAKFSFHFGANRWFSFTFETGSCLTSVASSVAPPSSLVRDKDGTIGPSNVPLESKRMAVHTMAKSLVGDIFRYNHKPHVSLVQVLHEVCSKVTGQGHVDRSLHKAAASALIKSTSNTTGNPLAVTPTPINGTQLHQVPKCQLLCIPAEIRLLIYNLVLVSKEPIVNAHKLLESDDSIDATDHDVRIGGIDARLLQTCRAVRLEAAPILYGSNTFYFSKQTHIEAFQGVELLMPSRLPVTSLEINLTSGKYGRLALLRNIILRLGPSDRYSSPRYRPGQDAKKIRHGIWRSWFMLFDRKQCFLLDFPTLETLTLDLSDWLLTADDALKIDRFVQKFKTPHGLNHLIVKGMSNEKNLQDLKAGLVKPGGTLEVLK